MAYINWPAIKTGVYIDFTADQFKNENQTKIET